jgi:hypothetical protein
VSERLSREIADLPRLEVRERESEASAGDLAMASVEDVREAPQAAPQGARPLVGQGAQ